MKACTYYQELISRLIDRELSPEEGEELRAHAETCEDCRAVYTAFSALSSLVSEELVDPPAELRENVMATIRRGEMKKKNKTRKHTWRIVSVAACAVLVVGVGALTLPRLLRAGSAKSAAPQAAYSVMEAPAQADRAAGSAESEEAVENEYSIFNSAVSDSFAAPATETTMSESDMIAQAMEAAEEPESVAEIVDVTGQGRGQAIAALLVGTQGDLPAGVSPDRRFLLRFDRDGVSSQVLISVYGERVFFISLSGEQSDMVLSDYSWSALRAKIYN